MVLERQANKLRPNSVVYKVKIFLWFPYFKPLYTLLNIIVPNFQFYLHVLVVLNHKGFNEAILSVSWLIALFFS